MSEEEKKEEKNEIEVKETKLSKKEKSKGREFMKLYDEKLPELLSTNIELQELALKTVRAKIEDATAVQAATIYGILHDKVMTVTGKKENDNNTINMYFGESMNKKDQEDLMMRVLNRAKSEKSVEAEFTSEEK